MQANWQWVPTAAVAVSMLGACTTRTVTHEVVREQPIVQQQPVVVAQAQPAAVERIVQMPTAPQEAISLPAPDYSGLAWRDGTIRPMPSPIVETPGASPANASRWIPGYWTIVSNDWVWVRGHWQ
jgi:WXXGXW repeat (2 copies)